MAMRYLLSGLFLLGITAVNASSCPNVKTLDTLDLTKYPGIWYEVASQNLPFLSSCQCSVYNFTCTSASCNTFDDHFTCNKDASKPGSDYDLVLKGKIPDINVPAKMEESPLEPWLPSAPYWVLEVGSEYEYAVVYACVGAVGVSAEYIYIFSRDPLKMPDLDGITTRLKAQGIDTSSIKTVPQTGCTYPGLSPHNGNLGSATCLQQGERKCMSDTVKCAYDRCEPCCSGLQCYHDDDAGDFCISKAEMVQPLNDTMIHL